MSMTGHRRCSRRPIRRIDEGLSAGKAFRSRRRELIHLMLRALRTPSVLEEGRGDLVLEGRDQFVVHLGGAAEQALDVALVDEDARAGRTGALGGGDAVE